MIRKKMRWGKGAEELRGELIQPLGERDSGDETPSQEPRGQQVLTGQLRQGTAFSLGGKLCQ